MIRCRITPNIKVNYTFLDIFHSFFISGKKRRYNIAVEKQLGILLNVPEVVLTASGRSALYHVLANLPQHRVIVPAYTCDVVVEAATLAGKDIAYAHVDMETLNISALPEMDLDTVVIATHQYGFPCNIKAICEECKKKGAVVIEDCAGALGLKIDGQMAGTFGDYAIFSFNASKLINAPASGGFLIAKNEADLKALKERIHFKPCTFKYKAQSLCKAMALCLDKNPFLHYCLSKVIRHDATKAHLSAEEYKTNDNKLDSYFYGFYNWQAYVVLKQLRQLQYLMDRRAELAEAYKTRLSRQYQNEKFDRQSCSIRYPIYVKDRERFRQRVRERGVETGYGFEHSVCPESYKEEIRLVKEITYLPYSSNYTQKEIDQIISVLNQKSDEQGINS